MLPRGCVHRGYRFLLCSAHAAYTAGLSHDGYVLHGTDDHRCAGGSWGPATPSINTATANPALCSSKEEHHDLAKPVRGLQRQQNATEQHLLTWFTRDANSPSLPVLDRVHNIHDVEQNNFDSPNMYYRYRLEYTETFARRTALPFIENQKYRHIANESCDRLRVVSSTLLVQRHLY